MTLKVDNIQNESSSEANVVLNSDGSISIPSQIKHVGDDNTLIEFETDTVKLQTAGTTRATVDSSGNVGIGTTSPSTKLEVQGDNQQIRCQVSSSKGVSLYGGSSSNTPAITYDGTLRFFDNGSGAGERLRIDSSGRLLVSTTTSENQIAGYGNAGIQLSSTTTAQAGLALIHRQNGINSHALVFARKREGAANNGLVTNGQILGVVSFQGYDSTQYRQSAEIRGVIDGDTGSNDTPGRLEFYTTSDSSAGVSLIATVVSSGNYFPNSSTTQNLGKLSKRWGELHVDTINRHVTAEPIIQASSGLTIYVSSSGDDNNDGTSSNPLRTVTEAAKRLPMVLTCGEIHRIKIQGSTYSSTSSNTIANKNGTGKIYSHGRSGVIDISPVTAGCVWNLVGGNLYIHGNTCEIRIQNFEFTNDASGSSGYLDVVDNYYVKFYSTNTYTINHQGGWSWAGGLKTLRNRYLEWDVDVNVTSSATSGLGAVLVFDSNENVHAQGSVTKAGTRYGNSGVSVVNGGLFHGGIDVDNFAYGIYFGVNHYNAEVGQRAMLNGSIIQNNTVGLKLNNGSYVRTYSVTYSANSTNIQASNSSNHN